ncbi:uncharacterized protein [Triticum aestivum]|uniref:uncharacterized protein n=1 Tax=Triticum aestivum TaxID=4565 RepID=UPI001D0022F4|nr:uncharacterized protein LOC123104966 [Triticum aestivum]
MFFVHLGGHGNQSVGRVSVSWSQSFPAQSSDSFPSCLFAMDRINMWIPRGKTLPAVDRLLLPPSRHSIRGRKEGRSMAEQAMDREAKEESRCSIACRTGTGDSFSGLGAASGAGHPSRSVSWLGSDDILEVKSEMGVSRIARKELR